MPEWTAHLRARLSQLRLAPAREAEIVEELAQHLDERYEELRRGGATDADARQLAIAELAEPESLAAHMRPLRQANVSPAIAPGTPRRSLLHDLADDLRYDVRTLRKQPGFAAAAVLTLAFGIGANSAMFALVDAALLRPLPFSDPGQLVMMWERSATSARERVSPRNLVDWSERTRTFSAMGGYIPGVGGMVMTGRDGLPETVSRQWVTAGIFDALGVRAVAGRTFLQADDRERRRVVVLSESFWRARFDADPAVVGRDIRLDGSPWTVVGVVPQEADIIGRSSIWAMLNISEVPEQTRTAYFLHAIGRLEPGITMEAAEEDTRAVAAALATAFPASNSGRGIFLEPLRDAAIGRELRQTSLLLLGVVAFVLLICCVNVANLLMARASVRRRELSVRTALGADRWRLVRQLLAESMMLSVIGGAIGIALGAAMLRMAPSLMPPELLPPAVNLAFNPRVVAFCAAAALLVGVLFGLAPAWHATTFTSSRGMATDGRSVTRSGARMREFLVATEVAAAVLLLVGTGLLLRTLIAVETVDRGYQADSVLTMIVDPIDQRYPTDADELRLYQAIEEETRAIPGVRSVAWATTLPLGTSYQGRYFFEIAGASLADDRPSADYQIVSASYFQTVDLPIVAGRAFTERDSAENPRVCIVNEAFVRRFVHGRSPIGLRLAVRPTAIPDQPAVVHEIVGVARQIKERPDETEELLQIYVPLAQDTPGDVFMMVRSATDSATALAPAVRAAIARIDDDRLISIRSIMTLDGVARQSTGPHRFRAVLVTAFAALALGLAMIGLFGILAYSVQQRVREFGIRRALGATTRDVVGVVVRGASRVVVSGALIGLALSVALGRLLATMLFGVQPLDPVTFALAAVALLVTAVVSSAGPAWRAAHVDPAVALRTE